MTSKIDPDLQDLADKAEGKDPAEDLLKCPKCQSFSVIKKGIGILCKDCKKFTSYKVMEKKEAIRDAKQKRRTGEIPEFTFFDEGIVEGFLKLPFDYLARVHKNEDLKLSPEESKQGAKLLNTITTKRLPVWLEKYSDEFAIALWFVMIMSPRLQMISESKKKKESLDKKDPESGSVKPVPFEDLFPKLPEEPRAA
jgi:ribosomal protein L44E